jgi:predicted permease
MLAGVAVVLLVACLNVGGLLLARAVARQRETLIRVALGAGSWRLLRLWLAESSLLSVLGATLGLLLAWLAVSALKAAAPPGIPRVEAIAIDLPVLAIAAVAALLAVIISTVAPLVVGRRRGIASGLRAGFVGAGDVPKRQAMRNLLTAAQCAGAATLVVLALMLTRSFIKLTTVDLGWDAAGVLSLHVEPPMPPNLRRPWARYVDWSDRLIARLEAMPGIRRAAITTQIPLSGEFFPSTIAKGKGKGTGDEGHWPGVMHNVTDGYLDSMGIRLISGRPFGAVDRFTAAQLIGAEGSKRERGVAMISESLARSLWPDRPPIGQALWLPDIDVVPWREVIGVVEDIHFHGVGELPALHVFVPYTQFPSSNPRLLVAGSGSAASIVPLVRRIVEEVEPGTHVEKIVPLDALVSRATAQPRFTSRVVALFGVLALVLAAVGIYGTLSYVVRARSREIGIRLALGASRGNILSQTLRRGLVPAVGGGIIGLGLAVVLARTFQSLLFELSPVDFGSFTAGAAVLLLVALGATLGPARRASRVDPAATLRTD